MKELQQAIFIALKWEFGKYKLFTLIIRKLIQISSLVLAWWFFAHFFGSVPVDKTTFLEALNSSKGYGYVIFILLVVFVAEPLFDLRKDLIFIAKNEFEYMKKYKGNKLKGITELVILKDVKFKIFMNYRLYLDRFLKEDNLEDFTSTLILLKLSSKEDLKEILENEKYKERIKEMEYKRKLSFFIITALHYNLYKGKVIFF